MRLRAANLVIAGVALLSGCVSSLPWAHPGWAIGRPDEERIEALTNALAALAPHAEARAEAALIARTTFARTAELRAKWRPLGPGPVNNLLINGGLRPRGLCYQWCNDLLEPLEALPLRYFSLHWGNAFWGRRLTEHNVPVVTGYGAPFAEGILLDAWRRGGWLIWMPVRDDREYPFVELSADKLEEYRPRAREQRGNFPARGNS